MYKGNPFADKSPRGERPAYTMTCCVQDRILRVRGFTEKECRAALEMMSLEKTVRKAVDVRLRKLAKLVPPVCGVCKRCECTHTTPCLDRRGQPCGWTDATHTLCTACAYGKGGQAADKKQRVTCPDCGATYTAGAPHMMFCAAHTCTECGTSYGYTITKEADGARICDKCKMGDELDGDE